MDELTAEIEWLRANMPRFPASEAAMMDRIGELLIERKRREGLA